MILIVQKVQHGMGYSVDPDQIAFSVWFKSTLFAQAWLSENLGSL